MSELKSKINKKTVIIGIIALLVIIGAFRSCLSSDEKKDFRAVPNIMGVDHTDAKKVLTDAGFEVTEIEADAESVLAGTIHKRTVKKGQVFKINDESNPNYSDNSYSPIAKDQKVVIYYAKEDYTYGSLPTKNNDPTKVNSDDTSTASATTEAAATTGKKETVDWKKFIKDYEEWVIDYIEMPEKYNENPNDFLLLADYSKSLIKMVEWAEDAEKLEDDLIDDAEALSEYLAALSRITAKLATVNF